MIHETAHTETFVVDDAVTEVHTIDRLVAELFVASGIADKEGVASDWVEASEDVDDSEGVLGVIQIIGIHVGALEEVDTDRRGLVAVGFGLAATVDEVTVVAVAETALHVAAYVVVLGIAEVHVGPGAEVSAGEFVGGAVDDFVGAERHVVDFVVGSE